MYSAQNSRPDIVYAVQQCARIFHVPQSLYTADIQRILQYLQGTNEEGLILTLSTKFQVSCYIDTDFAGLWNIEPEQDHFCVKLVPAPCQYLWGVI